MKLNFIFLNIFLQIFIQEINMINDVKFLKKISKGCNAQPIDNKYLCYKFLLHQILL